MPPKPCPCLLLVIPKAVDFESHPWRSYESFFNAACVVRGCQGIMHNTKPVFTAQFHPEAKGGPTDTEVTMGFKSLAMTWVKGQHASVPVKDLGLHMVPVHPRLPALHDKSRKTVYPLLCLFILYSYIQSFILLLTMFCFGSNESVSCCCDFGCQFLFDTFISLIKKGKDANIVSVMPQKPTIPPRAQVTNAHFCRFTTAFSKTHSPTRLPNT